MTRPPRDRWGLGGRLLAAILAVIVVAATTAWLVAAAIGPGIFREHLERSGTSDPAAFRHAEQAFTDASAISLALALLAALVTSVAVSVFLTRRIARLLGAARRAADRVARGDYTARVPAVRMGVEFEELAGAFNTMATDLERVEVTRRRVLGDLAHEMRTPVATLDGYLEAMQDGMAVADEATLEMLRQQAARLARLAEDVSLVTTTEEGHLTMRCEPAAADGVVEAAVAASRSSYADAGVGLELEVSGAARDAVLHADVARLGQVLTNLLDNARRHTPAGGSVRVGVERRGDTVRIRVTDTGEGVAAEHLPHLFERFYRVDAARDRDHGGSGVGLAIARAIARAHGGEVVAASAGLGRGTVVTVELPVAPPG